MERLRFRSAALGLALCVAAPGCSAVLPLGSDYTFGDGIDGGPSDASTPPDAPAADAGDAGTDAGCDVPTMDVACADRCGEVVLCGMTFTCGGCDGELSCGGAGTANACGCEAPPCALSTASWGDVAEQRIVAVAVDFEGNVFLAGDFRGTLRFGANVHTNAGPTRFDMFVVKLDPRGEVLWSRAFGGAADATSDRDQQVRAMAVDGAGNVVITGSASGVMNFGGGPIDTESDIVVAKLAPDGSHVFSAAYGTQFVAYPTALAIDPATYDIFVAGDFWGTLRFGALSGMTAAGTDAYFDMFLVRLRAADGVPQSSRRYGDGAEQQALALAAAAGHVHMAASFTGTFDFGPPNTRSLTSSTFYSLALAKLGAGSFNHVWSRQVGTDVSNPRLAADEAGNLYVTARFAGSVDITMPPLTTPRPSGSSFIARLAPDGTTTWARQYEDIDVEAVATGSDGSLYVAGRVFGAVDLGGGSIPYSGSQDAFVARFAPDGSHVFSRVFAAPVGNQSATGIAAAADDTVWLGVDFQGNVDLGTGELRTAGANDIALGRYVQ